MIAKHIADWVDKNGTKAKEDKNYAKIAKYGVIEGMVDAALVSGLFLVALGGLATLHDGLHKLTGK